MSCRASPCYGPSILRPSGGFWAGLNVSPPTTPRPCDPLPKPPPVNATTTPDAAALYGVLPIWAVELQAAVAVLTFYERDERDEVVGTPLGIPMRVPLAPAELVATAVTWDSMLVHDCVGFVFYLFDGGTRTGQIEVLERDDEILQIAIVRPEYSVLSVASGLVPQSAMVRFCSPATHLAALREVLQSLHVDTATSYLPTWDAIVTPHFHTLPLFATHNHDHGDVARVVWDRTKVALAEIGSLTRECTEAHVRNEFARAGRSAPPPSLSWQRL